MKPLSLKGNPQSQTGKSLMASNVGFQRFLQGKLALFLLKPNTLLAQASENGNEDGGGGVVEQVQAQVLPTQTR